MALLQRRPQTGPAISYYTIGQHRTVLLVGLGNIGNEFAGTRHNIGFLCIDAFVNTNDEFNGWAEKKDLKSYVSKGIMGDTLVIAIKPTTLMNLSGAAVQAATHFYKITPNNILVVHDELDIPFGQIRLRVGGSSAGHNGIKSVTETIGEEFGRVRIGIGPKQPPEMDSADYVLQKFSDEQTAQLPHLTREVGAILTEYIYSGQLPNETRSFLV
jgi:PTH1 family peptidyl-tRNA hydrolase